MSIITTNFSSMGLPEQLLMVLNKENYTEPTPIQSQTIPIALKHQDVLGSAQTGTGKTLAFVVPVITRILADDNVSALILTPTRELAQQVISVVKKLLGKKSTIKSVLLIGGEPFFKQKDQLKAKPKIIVGTPGRIIDHLSRKTLSPNFNFLVLDETDRMFDMGFGIQLETIINQLPEKRQTLMFSATFPAKVEKLASKYLIKPTRIFLNSKVVPLEKLKEETIMVKEVDKYKKLLLQLQERDGTVIIFVKTKFGAERLSGNLKKDNYSVSAMHGDLKQSMRVRVMNDFRNGLYKIMVATDIAARGLDVPHIQHVINYDLPSCPEDYIHRVGRTARAGAGGCAVNLITNQDQSKWDAIQRFIFPEKSPSGKAPSGFQRKYKNKRKYHFEDQHRKPKKFGSFSRKTAKKA